MCIRDRSGSVLANPDFTIVVYENKSEYLIEMIPASKALNCLLYTSDAADERSSVDLGGRRIIKKKKILEYIIYTSSLQTNQSSRWYHA